MADRRIEDGPPVWAGLQDRTQCSHQQRSAPFEGDVGADQCPGRAIAVGNDAEQPGIETPSDGVGQVVTTKARPGRAVTKYTKKANG